MWRFWWKLMLNFFISIILLHNYIYKLNIYSRILNNWNAITNSTFVQTAIEIKASRAEPSEAIYLTPSLKPFRLINEFYIVQTRGICLPSPLKSDRHNWKTQTTLRNNNSITRARTSIIVHKHFIWAKLSNFESHGQSELSNIDSHIML